MSSGFTKILGGPSQRQVLPRCETVPIAVLAIRLSSMCDDGSPPRSVYHGMVSYLPDNMVYIDLPFNFSDSKGEEDYETRITRLAKRLKTGALKK